MGDTKKFMIKHRIFLISLAGIAAISYYLLLSGKYIINASNPGANVLFIQSTILFIFTIIFITYLFTRAAYEKRKKKRK